MWACTTDSQQYMLHDFWPPSWRSVSHEVIGAWQWKCESHALFHSTANWVLTSHGTAFHGMPSTSGRYVQSRWVGACHTPSFLRVYCSEQWVRNAAAGCEIWVWYANNQLIKISHVHGAALSSQRDASVAILVAIQTSLELLWSHADCITSNIN